MWKKGFRRQTLWMLSGVVGFYTFLAVLMYSQFLSSLIYVSPIFTAGLSVARGVYSWHAFVEPVNDKDFYSSSIVFLNSKYFTYNDNHHIEHHKKAGLHWSKLDESFQKSKQEYINAKANSFDTALLAKPILFYLWFKRFDLIAVHYTPIDPNSAMSHEELIKILERRTLPLGGVRKECGWFRQSWEKGCLWLVKTLLIDSDISSSGWDWTESQALDDLGNPQPQSNQTDFREINL